MAKQLTEAQFSAAQDALDNRMRATKRGTPEREEVEIVNGLWERANALPDRSAEEREFRRAAIAQVAVKHGLVEVAS